jgi:predicted acyltransferase
VASGIIARTIYSLVRVPYGPETVSVQAAIYRSGYASWLPPKAASLAFALSIVAFYFVVLWGLYRKGIVLKV